MFIILSLITLLACSEKEDNSPKEITTPKITKSAEQPEVKKEPVKLPQQIAPIKKESKATPKTDHTLKNSDYRIEYNNGSIIAKTSKGGVLSTLYKPKKPEEGCEEEERAFVLSLIDGFATVEISGGGYCEGAAHPFGFQNWATVYVVKPFKKDAQIENFWTYNKVSITHFFPEEQVLKALLQDSVIKKYLPENAKPKTILALSEMLDGDCEISFRDLEYHFAFHHIKGDQIAVRFGLPYGCEVARGNFTQLGIYLPIPEKWKTRFNSAKKNKNLMKDIGL